MSNKKQDRLVSKMQKLLAMAEGNANENESMTAARQLHKLLAKHNLSLSDIQTEENAINLYQLLYRDQPWRRPIASAIAKLYFCEFYTEKYSGDRRKNYYSFVGSETNSKVAVAMYENIIDIIQKEARHESRKRFGKQNSPFVRSFWAGASSRIAQRCQEMYTESHEGNMVDDETGETLPALASVYSASEEANADFLASKGIRLKSKANPMRSKDAEGAMLGREAGNRVQLNQGIQKQSSPKLLG